MNYLADLPQAEQKRFMELLQEIEIKSAQTRLLDGGDTCFDICVSSFNQRAITEREIKCIKSCTDKFFHIQARCMQRWQEQMQIQQQKTQEFIEHDQLYEQKLETLQPSSSSS
mmetsp:Transcript_74454/g.118535  ORF Transcript_74454/g.118535 Transcript_74454/m.118535 type:complete len:113 (+) Transcript_74454:157-495(+)